jgi:uncharacterized protein YlaI
VRWSTRRETQVLDKDWLIQKYQVEGLSMVDIGRMVDRDPKTILHWMRKYGIHTRPRGDTRNFKGHRVTKRIQTIETRAKLRTYAKTTGKVPYLRNGEHFNKGKRGAVVHNWKGGITPERQTFYRSDEWKEVVKHVWKRDDAKCRRCGLDYRTVDRKSIRFHVHHMVSFSNKRLRANPINLVLLCDKCHRFVHSKKNITGEFLGTDISDSRTTD